MLMEQGANLTLDTPNAKRGTLAFALPVGCTLNRGLVFQYGDGGYKPAVLLVPYSCSDLGIIAVPDENIMKEKNMAKHDNVFSMSCNGPKMLVSKQTAKRGIISWKWKNLGNSAVEFGVVTDRDCRIDDGMHKKGKTGFASNSTGGSVLPLKLELTKQRSIEIICNLGNMTVQYILGEDTTRTESQPLILTGYTPGDAVRLAITLWSNGKVEMLSSQQTLSAGPALEFTVARLPFTPVCCSAGKGHVAVLSKAGELFLCGSNIDGQCGVGRNDPSLVADVVERFEQRAKSDDPELKFGSVRTLQFQQVDVPVAEAVRCGEDHTVVQTKDGRVFVFGDNSQHQLGFADAEAHMLPVELTLPNDCSARLIDAGPHQTLVVTTDGTLLICGPHLQSPWLAENPLPPNGLVASISPDELSTVSAGDALQGVLALVATKLCSEDQLDSSRCYGDESRVRLFLPPSPSSGDSHQMTCVDLDLEANICKCLSSDHAGELRHDWCSLPLHGSIARYEHGTGSLTLYHPEVQQQGTTALLGLQNFFSAIGSSPRPSEPAGVAREVLLDLLDPVAAVPDDKGIPLAPQGVGVHLLALASGLDRLRPFLRHTELKNPVPEDRVYCIKLFAKEVFTRIASSNTIAETLSLHANHPFCITGIQYEPVADAKDAEAKYSAFIGSELVAEGKVVFGETNKSQGALKSPLFINANSVIRLVVKMPEHPRANLGDEANAQWIAPDGTIFSILAAGTGGITGILCSPCPAVVHMCQHAGIFDSLLPVQPRERSPLIDGLGWASQELAGQSALTAFPNLVGVLCLNSIEASLRAQFLTLANGTVSEFVGCDFPPQLTGFVASAHEAVLSLVEHGGLGSNLVNAGAWAHRETLQQASMRVFVGMFRAFYPTSAQRAACLSRTLSRCVNAPLDGHGVGMFAAIREALSCPDVLWTEDFLESPVEVAQMEPDQSVAETTDGAEPVAAPKPTIVTFKLPALGEVAAGSLRDVFLQLLELASAAGSPLKQHAQPQHHAEQPLFRSAASDASQLLSLAVEQVLNGAWPIDDSSGTAQTPTSRSFTKAQGLEMIFVCAISSLRQTLGIADDAEFVAASQALSTCRFIRDVFPSALVCATSRSVKTSRLAVRCTLMGKQLLEVLAQLNNRLRSLTTCETALLAAIEVVVLESDHPYPYATGLRNRYRAQFSKEVRWMTVDFDPRCQLGQEEDHFSLLGRTDANCALPPTLVVENNNWPLAVVIVPGCQLDCELQSASSYLEAQNPESYFGFRCVISGYRFHPSMDERTFEFLETSVVNMLGTASMHLLGPSVDLGTEPDAQQDDAAMTIVYENLTWSEQCKGPKAILSEGGMVARRDESYNGAAVVSASPIADIGGVKSAKIQIKRYGVGNWAGTMSVGVTTAAPVGNEPNRSGQDTWILGSNTLVKNGSTVKDNYPDNGTDLSGLRENDTLEIKLHRSGNLHFIFNGRDAGPGATDVDYRKPLWIYVDIYGNTNAIKLTGKAAPLGWTAKSFSSSAVNSQVPRCPRQHKCIVSAYSQGDYKMGWSCDNCDTTGEMSSERWFCPACTYDLCFSCKSAPEPVESAADPAVQYALKPYKADLLAKGIYPPTEISLSDLLEQQTNWSPALTEPDHLQRFLNDFVEETKDSAGARLAAWLHRRTGDVIGDKCQVDWPARIAVNQGVTITLQVMNRLDGRAIFCNSASLQVMVGASTDAFKGASNAAIRESALLIDKAVDMFAKDRDKLGEPDNFKGELYAEHPFSPEEARLAHLISENKFSTDAVVTLPVTLADKAGRRYSFKYQPEKTGRMHVVVVLGGAVVAERHIDVTAETAESATPSPTADSPSGVDTQAARPKALQPEYCLAGGREDAEGELSFHRQIFALCPLSLHIPSPLLLVPLPLSV